MKKETEIAQLLDRGNARLVLVIPPDLSEKLVRGQTVGVQTLRDAGGREKSRGHQQLEARGL